MFPHTVGAGVRHFSLRVSASSHKVDAETLRENESSGQGPTYVWAMGLYQTTDRDYTHGFVDGVKYRLLTRQAYERFAPELLGLGDIGTRPTTMDAIAVVVDLEGFTAFCDQRETLVMVPAFLKEFIQWLMDSIRKQMTEQEVPAGIALWAHLPFFVKFMGDGLLVLWDAAAPGMDSVGRRNVIACVDEIRRAYTSEFLLNLSDEISFPPPRLRCGLSRGVVYSVGNGNDFVGPCINMAARLQKLPGTTFSFCTRGFALTENGAARFFTKELMCFDVQLRGFREREQVAILISEFNQLGESDIAFYR